MTQRLITLFILLISYTVIASENKPELDYSPKIPKEFAIDPPEWKSPTGESEAERYLKGYKALWWNCVLVRSGKLSARCPRFCSGTPGASAGCSDGVLNADNQIHSLVSSHSNEIIAKYLRKFVDGVDPQEKLNGYFKGVPREEKIE